MADGNGDNLRKAADNVYALLAARYLMPVMFMLVMAISGWAITRTLGQIDSSIIELKGSIKPLWDALGQHSKQLSDIQTSISTSNAKQDDLHDRIVDHEGRIRVLEHSGR